VSRAGPSWASLRRTALLPAVWHSLEQEEIYRLITRYLARQTSGEENERLATWVAEAPGHERTFEQLKTLWQHSATPPTTAKTAAALRNVKARLAPPPPRPTPSVVPRRRSRTYQLAVLGLVLLLGIGAGFYFYPRPTAPVAARLYRTPAGRRHTLRLADGSRVTLAPQSQLRYPATFAGHHRDVYLEGEAFFEVSKDAYRPFRVHSGRWVTQVLGTTFNVSAVREAPQMAVSLLEGRVEVLDKQAKFLLTPGQQLLADRATGRLYRQLFDPTRVSAWRHNQLIFKNEKLADVAGQIERLYGVHLVFADAATADVRLWATFNNEPLTAVLEALQLAGPIAYHREGQTIYLQLLPGSPPS